MNRTYTKDELIYENIKYGGGWILMGEKKEKEYVLHATGDTTMNGRIYVALPKGPISHEDKLKYNIM
jgi:hypothetical protein